MGCTKKMAKINQKYVTISDGRSISNKWNPAQAPQTQSHREKFGLFSNQTLGDFSPDGIMVPVTRFINIRVREIF